jgi:hypothetical protein
MSHIILNFLAVTLKTKIHVELIFNNSLTQYVQKYYPNINVKVNEIFSFSVVSLQNLVCV